MSMNIFTNVLLLNGQLARRRGPCASGTCERVFGPVKVQRCHCFNQEMYQSAVTMIIICSLSSKIDSTNSAVDVPSLKA
jgi:hypothetical protein